MIAEFAGGSPPGPGFTGTGFVVLGFCDEMASTLTGSGVCVGPVRVTALLLACPWEGLGRSVISSRLDVYGSGPFLDRVVCVFSARELPGEPSLTRE